MAAAGSHTFPEPCCPVPGEETSRPVKAAEDCANEGCKRIACHKYCAPVTSTPDVMIVHRRVFEYPQCSHQQHQHLAQSRAKPSCLPICTLQGVEFMPWDAHGGNMTSTATGMLMMLILMTWMWPLNADQCSLYHCQNIYSCFKKAVCLHYSL